jgi:hypothetical protein
MFGQQRWAPHAVFHQGRSLQVLCAGQEIVDVVINQGGYHQLISLAQFNFEGIFIHDEPFPCIERYPGNDPTDIMSLSSGSAGFQTVIIKFLYRLSCVKREKFHPHHGGPANPDCFLFQIAVSSDQGRCSDSLSLQGPNVLSRP